MTPSPNFDFRTDINAYRAFAVIAVFLNHLFPLFFPNGYLGVDLFFIISGYVICLSLEKRVQSNAKHITKGFFSRRIVRIVPPLLVFVLIVYTLSLLIIPPGSNLSLLSQRSALSSLFGLSNLYFYKQSLNYFGPLADLNPFTHTWSLGVEEQFYFFFQYFSFLFDHAVVVSVTSYLLHPFFLSLHLHYLLFFIVLTNPLPISYRNRVHSSFS